MPFKDEDLSNLLKKLLNDKLTNKLGLLEKKVKSEMEDLKLIKNSYSKFSNNLENLVKMSEAKILKDKIEQEKKLKERLRKEEQEKMRGKLRNKSTVRGRSSGRSLVASRTIGNLNKSREMGKSMIREKSQGNLITERKSRNGSVHEKSVRNINTFTGTKSKRGTGTDSNVKNVVKNLKNNIKETKKELQNEKHFRATKSVANLKSKNLLKNLRPKKKSDKNDKAKVKEQKREINLKNIKIEDLNIEKGEKIVNKTVVDVEIPKLSEELYVKKKDIKPCFSSIVSNSIFDKHILQFLDADSTLKLSSLKKEYLHYKSNFLENYLSKLKKILGIFIGQTIDDKINTFKVKFTEEQIKEPLKSFQMSRGCVKALNMIDDDLSLKVFGKPLNEENGSEISLVYKIYCKLLGYEDLYKIKNDKIFWEKFSKFLLENKGEKLHIYIINSVSHFSFDKKSVFYLKNLTADKAEKFKPIYFGKICGITGLFVFLIKEALEYCGVIEDKKTAPSRMYENLLYEKEVIDKINSIINSIKEMTTK